jgi:hypothetical protein
MIQGEYIMKHRRTAILLALCVTASACNISDTNLADGKIVYSDGLVTLHVSGVPNAVINATGDLQVNDKVIHVSDAQRGLLMLYYQNVADINHTGKEMGKVGAMMGGTALKNKMQGKSDTEQKQDAETGSQQLHQLSGKICQDQVNIKAVQDQLNAQLAEFKPYGNILTQDDVSSCHDDGKD